MTNKWQDATDYWIELTLEKYKGYDPDDLTQVFMRGPFAGWSERMVLELAIKMDDANTKVPRHKTQQGAYIMKTPTLEDILKIASFEFNEDGELILTSLDADFIGYHEGNHFGCHQGNHYGDHYGDHHGDHIGDHIGDK